jgi:ATP-dependent exoDNAse (exonuclease V) beta subunit
MLCEINKHERDQYISFKEEGHIYTLIDGDVIKHPVSCTTLISQYYEHFDANVAIEKMRNSKNGLKEKYIGLTDDDIKTLWDENRLDASSRGTNTHQVIEDFLNGKKVNDESDEFKMFLNFWSDWNKKYPTFKPYRLEWCVYDEKFRNNKGLCGSIDCVLSDDKGRLMIFDWKRSKEIKIKNNFGKMKYPFENLDDTNLNHYKLQLNIYRHILKNKYNMNVIYLALIILHPNQTGYHVIPINVMDLNNVWDKL